LISNLSSQYIKQGENFIDEAPNGVYSRLIKDNLLERHKEAIRFILNKGEPDTTIINKVLLFQPIIEDLHIDLCKEIYKNRITVDLPRAHEDSIIPFSKIAGVEHTGSLKNPRKYVPGCYRI
jgi:hypothetical protein